MLCGDFLCRRDLIVQQVAAQLFHGPQIADQVGGECQDPGDGIGPVEHLDRVERRHLEDGGDHQKPQAAGAGIPGRIRPGESWPRKDKNNHDPGKSFAGYFGFKNKELYLHRKTTQGIRYLVRIGKK